MIHDTQSAQISQKQDERNIYAIMKIMCPPGYHHSGFVATHALGHMMYGYTLLIPMAIILLILCSLLSLLVYIYVYMVFRNLLYDICCMDELKVWSVISERSQGYSRRISNLFLCILVVFEHRKDFPLCKTWVSHPRTISTCLINHRSNLFEFFLKVRITLKAA